MPLLQVITLGCSKNTVDTEHLLSQVQGRYELVPEGEERPFVDVLLVNTCGFIGDAKEQSIQVILEAAERKKAGAVGRLLVFGCLAQRYPAELPDLIPEKARIVGDQRPGGAVPDHEDLGQLVDEADLMIRGEGQELHILLFQNNGFE